MKSIPERRDEYHITIATLLGCELRYHPIGYYQFRIPGADPRSGLKWWSIDYNTAADAARAWLIENNHDLNGWCENDEERDDPHK